MRSMTRMVLALSLAVGAAACSNDKGKAADAALNNDLQMADQMKAPLTGVSATEMGSTSGSTGARRTSSGGYQRSSSSGTYGSTRASAPAERIEKHTQRDAAIGAATGAAIGIATSKNKVKGGLMGAVIGGALGAVVGNNVDKTRKKY